MVITNRHVCEDMPGGVLAGFKSDNPVPILLKIARISEKTDLCMLEGAYGLPALNPGSMVERGDKVAVFGFPLFDPGTLAQGYVIEETIVPIMDVMKGDKCPPSSTAGSIDVFGLFEIKVCTTYFRAYLTDTLIYPGNSGSPVVDSLGRVVGIAFAGNNTSHKGLFIGIEEIRQFLASAN